MWSRKMWFLDVYGPIYLPKWKFGIWLSPFLCNSVVSSQIGALQAASHQTKFDVINDVKLFPTVYCSIYCRKFWMLSNQMLRYKIKCTWFCNATSDWITNVAQSELCVNVESGNCHVIVAYGLLPLCHSRILEVGYRTNWAIAVVPSTLHALSCL